MHRMGMFYITFITNKQECLSIKHYVSRILNISSEVALSPEKGKYKRGVHKYMSVLVGGGKETLYDVIGYCYSIAQIMGTLTKVWDQSGRF